MIIEGQYWSVSYRQAIARDANKRVNGRKREFVMDPQGRLWVGYVHAANEAEGPAAIPLITDILWRAGERLEKI